jgi:hypothetical protein
MNFIFPTPHELKYGLRALKTIALADGELHRTEREVITAAQAVFGDQTNLDALEPITPEELAAGIVSPATRFQLVGGMIVTCMADGEVNPKETECLRRFADALAIDDGAIGQLEHIAQGQYLRARLDILRRFWAVKKLRDLAKEEGVGVYFKAALGLLGVREDTKTIETYKGFANRPPGSLGRAYYDYVVRNGFQWPGEKGAPPGIIIYHDFAHVLSGYDTTAEDEILVVGFSAGFASYELLSIFTFVLSQFQLGLQTAPFVPPSTMKLDPARFMAALQRGAAMNINLNEGWDYWEVLDEQVEDLRERYNILPESHYSPK